MLTSPVIVRLRAKPELGEGILVGLETQIVPLTNAAGEVERDEAGPIMVKRREATVCWVNDRSHFFTCDLTELEWVEVVAVRTLDEMKQEVVEEVMDLLEEAEDTETEREDGEPENSDDANPNSDQD